jgi:hypothetical protein
MSEREHPAVTVVLTYDCDECGEEMTAETDALLLSNPPKWRHRCPNGHRALLLRSYPAVATRRTDV